VTALARAAAPRLPLRPRLRSRRRSDPLLTSPAPYPTSPPHPANSPPSSPYPLHQLIHSSTHPLIHLSSYQLLNSSTPPLLHLSTYPLIHLSYPLIHLSTYPLIPLIHLSTYPLLHFSTLHSSTPPLLHSPAARPAPEALAEKLPQKKSYAYFYAQIRTLCLANHSNF
jgi:hypothetical protein